MKIIMEASGNAPDIIRLIAAYDSLPKEKQTAALSESTAVLMEGWADLTEEQRDVFAKAISGLSAGNKIMKEFGKKENEKIA